LRRFGMSLVLAGEPLAVAPHVGFVSMGVTDRRERLRELDFGAMEEAEVVAEVHRSPPKVDNAVPAGPGWVAGRDVTGAGPPTVGAGAGAPSRASPVSDTAATLNMGCSTGCRRRGRGR
jgi:hypothetical protein